MNQYYRYIHRYLPLLVILFCRKLVDDLPDIYVDCKKTATKYEVSKENHRRQYAVLPCQHDSSGYISNIIALYIMMVSY